MRRNEGIDPGDWLEEVERIRGRMLVIEGLLASMVLDQTLERRDRLGKALQNAESVFEMVNRLALSMRYNLRSSVPPESSTEKLPPGLK